MKLLLLTVNAMYRLLRFLKRKANPLGQIAIVSLPINTFDAAVYICLFITVVMGFMPGLLRSLATIFGYLAVYGGARAAAGAAPDRAIQDAAGAALVTFVIVFLLAGSMAVVFDRIIPLGHEPACLQGSQWRPVLSTAGQQGLRSLPP